jgi:hypothetical protein
MNSFRAKVRSAVNGHEREADIMTCEACGSLIFGIFQMVGDDHFHLQCMDCGVSYCPGGHCENSDASPVAEADGEVELVTQAELAGMRCRVCGCTNSQPCQGAPCFWVEPNLCSRCVASLAEST